jgi:hypothetical protein
MVTKEKVLATLKELPEEFSLDELFERLILFEKIETGLKQVKEGKTISHETVKSRVKAWQK